MIMLKTNKPKLTDVPFLVQIATSNYNLPNSLDKFPTNAWSLPLSRSPETSSHMEHDTHVRRLPGSFSWTSLADGLVPKSAINRYDYKATVLLVAVFLRDPTARC